MICLSNTLYALFMETKRNFVAQNKDNSYLGQSKFSYELTLWFTSIEKSIIFVMGNAIPWEVLMPSTKFEGLCYPTHFLKSSGSVIRNKCHRQNLRGYATPPTSWKVVVVLLGINVLNTELNKPHFLRDEIILMHCSLQIKQNIYSILNRHLSCSYSDTIYSKS